MTRGNADQLFSSLCGARDDASGADDDAGLQRNVVDEDRADAEQAVLSPSVE